MTPARRTGPGLAEKVDALAVSLPACGWGPAAFDARVPGALSLRYVAREEGGDRDG